MARRVRRVFSRRSRCTLVASSLLAMAILAFSDMSGPDGSAIASTRQGASSAEESGILRDSFRAVGGVPVSSPRESYFSTELLQPRIGQPVLREDGETFVAHLALEGPYDAGQVSGRLTAPDGVTYPLTTVSVTPRTVAGSDLEVMLHPTALGTVQEVVFELPPGTPADLYGIEIDMEGTMYESVSAVRVYDAYPLSWGFIQITDTHVGYSGALSRLESLVTEANFLDPELVVVTGDLCEHQNPGTDWPQQFLGAVSELHVPVYVIPGNHDYYNDGESYDSGQPLRYFSEINRFHNSVVTLGGARFYGVDTQYDHGLFQFYRCHGPSTAALDWIAADIDGLGASDRPRFLLMHGPNYDWLVWNTANVSSVRDLMSAGAFDLALAGHTHRFETFLNSGTNSLGRNDFQNADDWLRDVAFPGYPLHVQTSALGKDDGDGCGWRWVQVDGTDVTFFSADTDGDGYRNTEYPWMPGDLVFSVVSDTSGLITSSVENLHYETWYDVRHYVPADPATDYTVSGGMLLRRLQDGTVVVAVSSVGPLATSVVTLEPSTGIENETFALRIVGASPNPFNPATTISFELPEAGHAELEVFSVTGRRIRELVDTRLEAGPHSVIWRGDDRDGASVASGVYFARLCSGGREARARMVFLK